MDTTWVILSLFFVFAVGFCAGIAVTAQLLGLYGPQTRSETPQGEVKNTFLAEKKAERPDVKAAYRYSRPEYRSEMEDNLGFRELKE